MPNLKGLSDDELLQLYHIRRRQVSGSGISGAGALVLAAPSGGLSLLGLGYTLPRALYCGHQKNNIADELRHRGVAKPSVNCGDIAIPLAVGAVGFAVGAGAEAIGYVASYADPSSLMAPCDSGAGHHSGFEEGVVGGASDHFVAMAHPEDASHAVSTMIHGVAMNGPPDVTETSSEIIGKVLTGTSIVEAIAAAVGRPLEEIEKTLRNASGFSHCCDICGRCIDKGYRYQCIQCSQSAKRSWDLVCKEIYRSSNLQASWFCGKCVSCLRTAPCRYHGVEIWDASRHGKPMMNPNMVCASCREMMQGASRFWQCLQCPISTSYPMGLCLECHRQDMVLDSQTTHYSDHTKALILASGHDGITQAPQCASCRSYIYQGMPWYYCQTCRGGGYCVCAACFAIEGLLHAKHRVEHVT